MKRIAFALFILLGCAPALALLTPAAFSPGTFSRSQTIDDRDPDAGKVVAYRDDFGVPHIYAPTAEQGAYAVGYAQAEDRLEELLKNYLRACGEMSAAFGPAEFAGDVESQLWRHYEIARKNYGRLRPEVRKHLSAFVEGVNDYMNVHKSEVPAWWGERKVDVFMPVAFGRYRMWPWTAGQALQELQAAGIKPNFTAEARSSNEIAFAPSRTSVHAPILIIDPHLGWWGANRFWEFRIHAGELHGSGFTFPGVPYVLLGHNDDVAWAMTTGGPDTADIYRLSLNPSNPREYKYDDGWKTLTARRVSISVKGEAKPREITFYDSHNGPVVAKTGNEAYVAKLAYADEVQMVDEIYMFNIAKNMTDFRKGLALTRMPPQNMMVADTSGNIYYQRTGRVPIRPDGYDFTKPVDGSTSKTEWLGIHPASDLVQIENPPQGYMQNCNVAPDVMMVGSPLTPDKWKNYLFNQPSGRIHQRAARAVQLADAATAVTPEQARAMAVDTYCYQFDRWVAALKQADAKFGHDCRQDADCSSGLRDIVAWNGRSDADSKGALKFYYWRHACMTAIPSYRELVSRLADYMEALRKPKPAALPPTDEELKGMIAALSAAMKSLRLDFGTLEVAYGQVFRVGRDDKSWPVGGGGLTGGREDEGMATLRAVNFSEAKPDRTRWGGTGQTCTQVVVLTKPIQSWSQPPIGQSDHPDSPFYRDQAEKLFSRGQMKPTWYQKSELLKHVVSRVELKTSLTAASTAGNRCENLLALKIPATTIQVAQVVPAGAYKPLAGYPAAQRRGGFVVVAPEDLPEFCRVAGVISPVEDSEIKFEVWLPTSGWNGKFVGVGNGGLAGFIFDFEMSDPVARHYATASTNTGHDGGLQDASFALGHPQKVIDYGYRAVHEMTIKVKQIIAAFYGKPPAVSYWTGCSAGGRQGLMEAQRFPSDYDGIAVGSPGTFTTHELAAGLWRRRALDGNPDARLPPSKLQLLHKAVLQACDGLDGVVDGVLEAPDRCTFDPKVLECKGEDRASCLTAPQVELVRMFYDPVRNPRTGKEIFPGMARGGELIWGTGLSTMPATRRDGFVDYLRYAILRDPNWNVATFDFDSDLARADRLDNGARNAIDPNLRPFFQRGGKLLHYHGWSDGRPFGSIDYYKSVLDYLGAAAHVDDSYRLFMAPGMGHCGDGDGPNTFDPIAALERWVEHGDAPDEMIASHWIDGKVDRTRPLCPYPKIAKYKGTGSTDDASNFVCVAR